MLGTELFGRRKLILALVLTMTSLHIDNRQLQGGGCKSVPYPLYQNRLAQFEFGIRHEHLPDREKGKRHSRSFFERNLGWHQKAGCGPERTRTRHTCRFPALPSGSGRRTGTRDRSDKIHKRRSGRRIKSYAITEFDTSYSCARGNNSAGTVAADNMWEVDLNAGYAVANGDIV
jgi:hypothetical protein